MTTDSTPTEPRGMMQAIPHCPIGAGCQHARAHRERAGCDEHHCTPFPTAPAETDTRLDALVEEIIGPLDRYASTRQGFGQVWKPHYECNEEESAWVKRYSDRLQPERDELMQAIRSALVKAQEMGREEAK